MKKLLVLVAGIVVGLTGCAVERTVVDSGAELFSVDCGGTSRGINYCLEKAGRTCAASGYTILSNDGETAAGLDDAALADLSDFMQYASDRNRMVFTCNR